MLFRLQQSRDDLQKAYELCFELAGPKYIINDLISQLTHSEWALGNYARVEAYLTFLKERNHESAYLSLATLYEQAGYFEKADNIRNEYIHFLQTRRSKLTLWQEFVKDKLEYIVLKIRAKYKEAEPFIRRAIIWASEIRPERPDVIAMQKRELITNLVHQNRLLEAELLAR